MGRRGLDVLALTSAQWDISDPAAAEGIVGPGDVVVNCAAYTAVDAAESDAERAHAVNAVGPGNVARACAEAGARMIHVSTDYVFNGVFDGAPRPYDIDDATGPLSVYGKTKLAGEQAVHEALPKAHVVRTAWVYTGVGSDFVGVMRRLAGGDGPVAWWSTRSARRRTSRIWSRCCWKSPTGTPRRRCCTSPMTAQPAGSSRRGRCSRASGPTPNGCNRWPPRTPRPAPRPPYSALSGRATAAAGLAPLRPWRDALAAALLAANCAPATLDAVSDELFVVTVTYSPGPHLGRFLATLSHATDRPVTVIMADNGSTDGAPEEAVERYPNARLLRTGGNLGYGTAVNRAVAEISKVPECSDFFIVANPDVQWGPGSIDVLLEAAERWPRAASLGPLIRDPDGSVYPSARHLPSLIRGGMHAVVGPLWKSNPWTAAYRQDRLEPSERPVGWLSGSCLLLRGAAFDEVGGFDERYFMYMEDVDLGDRLGEAGWQNVYVPSAEMLHDKGHATGRDPARNLAAHHRSTYTFLADRHDSGGRRLCGGR